MPDHSQPSAVVREPPQGALALWLAKRAASLPAGLLHVTRREGAVAEIVAMARGFAPDLEVIALPAWDSLPHDRARPSRRVTGARVAGLAAIAEAPGRPRLVVSGAAGLLQRVPAGARLKERRVRLAPGDEAAPDWLHATLAAFGYQFEERVEEAGTASLRANGADIYPAGAERPVRLEWDGDRIVALHEFDPLDQRSTGERAAVTLLPATEGFAVPGEPVSEVADRLLPERSETLFDALPAAAVSLEAGAEDRIADWLDTIDDAWQARRLTGALTPPAQLYLSADEVTSALTGRSVFRFAPDRGAPIAETVPPARTAAALSALATERAADDAVVICASDRPALTRLLRRRLHPAPSMLASWHDELPPRRIGLLELPLTSGFRQDGRTVLAGDVAIPQKRAANPAGALGAAELRTGDLVVEPEHGLARLAGLTMLEEGAARECLVLAFAADQRLLIDAEEAGRVWRYGSAEAAAAPDRLTGEAWRRRRDEVASEIAEVAAGIAARRRARAATEAPSIAPSRSAMERFARRVPYALTEDQQAAIDATLADMAHTVPMERLVCGDVGFGKTEVALHAAAAAALAGFQVAVAAPTTLLARQHLETFRRRLSPLGLTPAPLLRSSRSAESRATLAGLRDGQVRIVIGTQALASGVRFERLGLVVIDEEQRFGEAQKQRLRALARGVHALTMTATPLPRSLQAALLGLFELSLLTTPPAARQRGRSEIVEFDDALVRAALLREARRGGQSFFVCPRIEDMAPMAARLGKLVPELTLGASAWQAARRGVGSRDAGVCRRQIRRSPGHRHHRGRARHPQRQHDAGLAPRSLRAGAAPSVARPGRTRAGAGERLPADRSRASPFRAGAQAARTLGRARRSRRRLRGERRRSRPARRRRHPGRTPGRPCPPAGE